MVCHICPKLDKITQPFLKNNVFYNNIWSQQAMVQEKIKSKRTPISGEKDARLNELEKLKAKRNSMKTTHNLPIKAKQKLEFQQSKLKGFMTF